MYIISCKPFRDAARQFPNSRIAIEDYYLVLRNGTFNTPDELRQVFPSLDNFKHRDRWWIIDNGGIHFDEIRGLALFNPLTSTAAPHFVACPQDGRTSAAPPQCDTAVAGGAEFPRESARQ